MKKRRRGIGQVSLERALSKMGYASRTQARALIVSGKVKISGRIVRDPLLKVRPESGTIEVEGARVLRQKHLTIALHKPRGLVTTRSDEKNRPTVYSLLSGAHTRLIAIGRLDLATSGLLLFTNDTQFSNWITDPANKVPRMYAVSVRGEMGDDALAVLKAGILDSDSGERLRPDEVKIRKRSKRETHLLVELSEGKNREIRRMFAALGHEVSALKRISFGGIELGDLTLGKWRELTLEELRLAFPGAPIRA